MPKSGHSAARLKLIHGQKGDGIATAKAVFMVTLLIITAALFAAGFFVEAVSAAAAPLGYQDENGFHFGREESASAQEFEIENPS